MQPHDAPSKSTQVGALEHRSMAYSMAAAAAGVSLMALAAPAEGKVFITTHINIPVTSTVSLDLNHDGVRIFRLGSAAIAQDTSTAHPGFRWVLTRRTFTRRVYTAGEFSIQNKRVLKSCEKLPIGKSGYFGQYGFMAGRAGTAYTTANPVGNWGNGNPIVLWA